MNRSGAGPRRLLLHIGHSKTGSSYLQQVFLLSRDTLAEHGIDYPVDDAHLGLDDATITSGNAVTALDSAADLDRHLASTPADRHLLLSSEMLFGALYVTEDASFVADVAAAHSFDSIEILLFIRDPLDHVLSQWQQRVKRRGLTAGRDEFLETYEHPVRVLAVLEQLAALPQVTTTVRNYSRCRDELHHEAAAWLGVDPSALSLPATALVNRSLTPSEEALQLAFNRHLGECGHLIADPLCQQLPGLRATIRRPSPAAQAALLDRLHEPIAGVNRLVDADQRYATDVVDDDHDAVLTFTPEQLDVIASSLAAHLTPRVASEPPPAPEPAGFATRARGQLDRLRRLPAAVRRGVAARRA